MNFLQYLYDGAAPGWLYLPLAIAGVVCMVYIFKLCSAWEMADGWQEGVCTLLMPFTVVLIGPHVAGSAGAFIASVAGFSMDDSFLAGMTVYFGLLLLLFFSALCYGLSGR